MVINSTSDFVSSPSLPHMDNFSHSSQIHSTRPSADSFNVYNAYDSLMAPTIATATSLDLLNARNTAYIDLHNAYKQSKAEVQRQEMEITYLRNLTTTLAASAPRSIPTESTISLSSSLLTPKNEDRANYPKIRFWTEAEWTEFVEKCRSRGQHIDKLGFLTDSDGAPLSKTCSKRMSGVAKMNWNEMRQNAMHPSSWMKKTNKAKEFFKHQMMTQFPEFRLADNDWKLEQWAIVRYPDWIASLRKEEGSDNSFKRRSNDNNKPKKRKRLSSPPDDVSVIEIDDDSVEFPTPAPETSTPVPMPVSETSTPVPMPVSETSAPVSETSAPVPMPVSMPVSTPASEISTPASETSSPVSMPAPEISVPVPEISAPIPQISASAFQTSTPASQIPSPASQISTPTTETFSPTLQISVPISESQLFTSAPQMSTLTPQISASAPQVSASAPQVSAPASQMSASQVSPLENNSHAATSSVPPRFHRPTPRRVLDPLKNLSIPPPSVTVPQSADQALPSLIKKSNSKPLQIKDGLTTARNLYAIDYLTAHPDATESEFSAAWKTCDTMIKKKYQDLSKERTKAKKIAHSQLHAASSSAQPASMEFTFSISQ